MMDQKGYLSLCYKLKNHLNMIDSRPYESLASSWKVLRFLPKRLWCEVLHIGSKFNRLLRILQAAAGNDKFQRIPERQITPLGR